MDISYATNTISECQGHNTEQPRQDSYGRAYVLEQGRQALDNNPMRKVKQQYEKESVSGGCY